MPSDLSVSRIGGVTAGPEPVRPRPAGAAAPQPAVVAEPPPAAPRPDDKPLANPALRLDPGLAIVVIEFRDGDGKVRETIPTQAQLDAYRSWQRSSGAGEAPVPVAGGREPARPDAARIVGPGQGGPGQAGPGTGADSGGGEQAGGGMGGGGMGGAPAGVAAAEVAAAMKDASGRGEVKASETGGT